LEILKPVLRVVAPGASTTVQGAPRYGEGSSGVPRGGAMDLRSLADANAALGNARLAAGLEITVAGPELELLAPARVNVAGELDCAPAGPWPRSLRAGDRVKFGRVRGGVRAYLTIDGGLAEPAPASGLRKLRPGQVLGRTQEPPRTGRVPPHRERSRGDPFVLRAIPGPHLAWFSAAGIETFFTSEYVLSPRSDRRGSRLDGPLVELARPADLPPEGVAPGAVQIPGDGLPIVLGPDGPVTGGYPRIASVIGADLPRLARARPGQRIRFARATLADALEAWRTG
jgi:antagonist of KipI